jgi:hypothetical protein
MSKQFILVSKKDMNSPIVKVGDAYGVTPVRHVTITTMKGALNVPVYNDDTVQVHNGVRYQALSIFLRNRNIISVM